MADSSDELALKLGRKILASARKLSATKTVHRDDFAVTHVKLRLPIARFEGLTFALSAKGSDPAAMNADSSDPVESDSDPVA